MTEKQERMLRVNEWDFELMLKYGVNWFGAWENLERAPPKDWKELYERGKRDKLMWEAKRDYFDGE